MERKSVVDQIEITRGGIQIRIAKLIVDGEKEIHTGWHRTTVEDPSLATATMQAVNDHLVAMGEAALDVEDIDRVVALVDTAAVKLSPAPMKDSPFATMALANKRLDDTVKLDTEV